MVFYSSVITVMHGPINIRFIMIPCASNLTEYNLDVVPAVPVLENKKY